MRKLFPYMLILLLLAIVTAAAQKNTSWRYGCRQECGRKNNICLQEAQGDGPKKEECEKKYRYCRYLCDNPLRKD